MPNSDSDRDDDDVPALSKETLQALTEFYEEQQASLQTHGETSGDYHATFKEDWQLSQFWYDDQTVQNLSDHVSSITDEGSRIALISCPTLYKEIKRKCSSCKVKLFEFDKRFAQFGDDYHFYDYQNPLDFPEEFKQYFDVVIADPPFLSDECLTKTAVSIRYLATSKIILCTGAVMGDLAKRLLKVGETRFKPHHKNNLGNEFACFINYEADF